MVGFRLTVLTGSGVVTDLGLGASFGVDGTAALGTGVFGSEVLKGTTAPDFASLIASEIDLAFSTGFCARDKASDFAGAVVGELASIGFRARLAAGVESWFEIGLSATFGPRNPVMFLDTALIESKTTTSAPTRTNGFIPN